MSVCLWTLAQVRSNGAVAEMKQMHYQETKRIKKHIVSFRARRRQERERIQRNSQGSREE